MTIPHEIPLGAQAMIEQYAALVRTAEAANIHAHAARADADRATALLQEYWRMIQIPKGAYLVEKGTHVVLVGGADYPPLVAVALIEQPPQG